MYNLGSTSVFADPNFPSTAFVRCERWELSNLKNARVGLRTELTMASAFLLRLVLAYANVLLFSLSKPSFVVEVVS